MRGIFLCQATKYVYDGKRHFGYTLGMIQEPKNYHLLCDFSDYPRLFEGGAQFCVLDTETTGKCAERERITEIGAIRFDKNGENGKFGTLVNPGKPIPPFITQITNITDEMVSGAPTAETVIPQFMEFSKGCILIAHNAPFDLQFINHELMRLGMDTLQNDTIDTLRLTRRTFPTFGHWNQPFLAETLGINIVSAHRAEDDARVCKEIFLRALSAIANPPPF